jgi:hypothetical protein
MPSLNTQQPSAICFPVQAVKRNAYGFCLPVSFNPFDASTIRMDGKRFKQGPGSDTMTLSLIKLAGIINKQGD